MPTDDAAALTGREIELKLEVLPADIEQLTTAASQVSGAVHTTMLTSVYFDTPDQMLHQAGVSLRVRHDGDRRIQTVKVDASRGAGLFDRPECEFEIEGDTPDLDDARSELAARFGKKVMKRIRPVFRSDVTRTKMLAVVDDAAIEFVIDQGTVVADNVSAPICEIELELKSGGLSALFALARRLGEAGAVRLGVLSKAERGYLLLAPPSDSSSKADPIMLDSDMTAAAAFRMIAWSCLRQYRLNETVLIATGDADALHQARVALRRLRSALSLFKSVIEDESYDRLRSELRWLSGVLGEARNLDVLIELASGIGGLDRLQTERAGAYKLVGETLAAPRTRRLMLDLAEWLTLGFQDEAHKGPLIVDFATHRLEHLRKRLKKNGTHFAELSDEDRHRVRIDAKKMRYATEFFKSLYPAKKSARRHKRFRNALETFQTILGDLNDQATGRLVLERFGLGNLCPEAWSIPADRSRLIDQGAATYDSLLEVERFW